MKKIFFPVLMVIVLLAGLDSCQKESTAIHSKMQVKVNHSLVVCSYVTLWVGMIFLKYSCFSSFYTVRRGGIYSGSRGVLT